MAFCLPQHLQGKFREALANGSITPSKMLDMTSEERRSLFADILGKENAKDVNQHVEEKLLLKDQQRGLTTWAKTMAGLSQRARADFVDKIAKLDRVLSPDEEHAFLADLAAHKLGTTVTLDETRQIYQLAQKAQEAKQTPTTNLSGVSDEYLKAAEELRNYIANLKPTTAGASIGKNLAVIGRNHLLMNPATPLKTSVSQFMNSAIDVFTRRIATGQIKGVVGDIAAQANREAWQTFMKTGLNTASMEHIDDTGKLGEGRNFEVNTGVDKSSAPVRAVEKVVRGYAKATTKVAIDWEHNISFTKFYQKAFFDAANILATKAAKGDRAEAEALMRDAARIQPQTDMGAMLRNQAQEHAARVTSTNATFIGNLALGVKDALNGTRSVFGVKVGKAGLGDIIVPIAKIPANIISNGIETAGVGIPLGIADMIRGRSLMASDDILMKQKGLAQFGKGFQTLARTVGVLGLAAYLSSSLTKQDFKSDIYGDNFVKIGGTWVNMEYLSAISPALAGMMTVRKDAKTGQTAGATAGQYVAGSTGALKKLPAINDIQQIVTALTNPNSSKGIEKYAKTFFTSRGVPAFIPKLNSPTPIKGLFFSTSGLPTQQELGKLKAH